MKNRTKIFTIISFLSGIVFVLAQSYTPLEQSLPQTLGTSFGFNASTPSSMYDVISTIFILLFSSCFVAALVMSSYAGLLFVKATSTIEVSEARKILSKAVYGVIGIFAMYLLLLTINPDMLRGDLGLTSIKNTSPTVATTPNTGGTTGSQTSAQDSAALQSIISTESSVRSRLGGDSSINKSACTSIGQTNCTSVGGLSEETIQLIIRLKSTCTGASVIVTGGTEWWLHSENTAHRPGTRSNGGGAVDLRKDSTLDSCIKNISNPTNAGKGCNSKYTWSTFSFCDEIATDAHWHIQ